MKLSCKIVPTFILLDCVAFTILVIVPLVSGKMILIGHISGSQVIYGTVIVFWLLCTLLVISRYMHNKCKKNKIIMFAASAFSAAALLGTLFLYLLFMADSSAYYTFYSPDRNYSVIAEERSWLLAGSVILYERTSPFLVEQKAVLITDDGFHAISSDAYEIQWDGNVVTFTVETTNWDKSRDTAVVELRTRYKKRDAV